MSDEIYVTKPSLPPIDEYFDQLESVWESGILTHNGPKVQLLEKKLREKLGLGNFDIVVNGTTALQLAIKALDLEGEIITTPYSFIATSHSIKWNGLNPVFVDTDEQIGNLMPERVEEAINKNTGGILAVHNYGIPGDVEGMQNIAEK